MWLVLNLALLVSHLATGRIDAETGRIALWLSPALLVGLLIGEKLHHRLSEHAFRLFVFITLGLAGAAILVRG
jgi:hypothetical protein